MMKQPLTLLALLPLAGCISFGAKPPPSLLTLNATAVVAVGAAQSSASARSIVIQVPAVPAALATQRLPVMATPTSIAYLTNTAWSEPPARLFARLLADTVTSRAGLVVLSSVQSISDPSSTLTGELRMFGVDTASGSAVVTYDAALVRAGQTAVEKRRFEARAPVAVVDGPNAGAALNVAANQVAGEVADWIKSR